MNGAFFCQPCDKIFSGETPYNAHLASEKHKKKIDSIELGDSPQSISNYIELKLDEHIQKCGSDFKCMICNVIMNDLSTATSHVKGQKHLKTTARLSSSGLDVNFSTLQDIELDPNVKKCGTEYICSACNVFMNDMSVVSSHLKGQKHLKKISMSFGSSNKENSASVLVANSSNIAPELSKCEKSEFKLDENIVKNGIMYECKLCYTVMNDILTATSHAKGQKHLKAISKLKYASGALNAGDVDSNSSKIGDLLEYKPDQFIEKSGSEYKCNACNVFMNDISMAVSHTRGQKHLKNISKLNIPQNFVSSNITLSESELSLDSSDSNNSFKSVASDCSKPAFNDFSVDDCCIEKLGNDYVCHACNVYMNSESTIKSHLNGQKHLKNKQGYIMSPSPKSLDGIRNNKNNSGSVDGGDVYLFNKNISFNTYSVEDVTETVQVFNASEPVKF